MSGRAVAGGARPPGGARGEAVIYAFADCRMDVGRLEFQRAGLPYPLEPQVFGVLAYLLEHRDRVVSKDELLDHVWGHRFVGDAALVSRIMAARKAVGDSGREQRLIKTLHGRGYRYVGPVTAADPDPAEVPSPAFPEGTVTFLVSEPESAVPLAADRVSVARHLALLREAVAANGGAVLETVGDAVYAVFAAPAGAVAAALAGQFALRREDWAANGLPGPLRARMGLHTGEAEHRDREGQGRYPAGYGGAAPDRCARLAGAAHAGQVLLSEATAALVRDALPVEAALRDLGAHRLEEGRPAEHLYQLVPPNITGTFPVLRGAEDRPHNLPRPLTSFFGREREAAEVHRLLAASPLVTLAGPGGGGKTRLALRVAADILVGTPDGPPAGAPGEAGRSLPDVRDGVWYVDLAPLADGALVPQAVAAAVGIREVPGQPLTAVLAGALRGRALLLLLDNCEHLLDACAQLVEALLRAAPRLRVLTTSREPLRAAGEAVYRVPSLAVPAAPTLPLRGEPPERIASYPSVRLFVERARAARPDFRFVPEHALAVAEICRRLDGLPLAIELAAARVRVLSVEQIAARLDDRFRLLSPGPRTAVPQKQTLRATLDWSYALLSPAEQALFQCLAVFAGGWTLEAAEAVGDEGESGGADVLDRLTSLVDKSLVDVDLAAEATAGVEGGAAAASVGGATGAAVPGTVRYRLLETVRQYATECLEQSDNASRARGAHARYFLALAEGGSVELSGPEPARWHARLEAEHENVRQALAWWVGCGDGRQALRLAAAMHWFWYHRRHWDEGYAWPARALALPGAQARTPVRATVLEGAALFAMWRDPAAAQAMWEESIAISLEHADHAEAAVTEAYLAWMLVRRGRLDEARVRAEAALELARRDADAGALSNALALLAAVAARQGEHVAARAHHEEALALRRATGNVSGLSLLLLDAAKAAFLAGDLGRTRSLAEDALRTAREAGIRQAVEEELRLLARAALAQGDLATAEARAVELVAHVQDQDAAAEADALALLGHVVQAAGDRGRAAELYRAVLDLVRRLPDPGETHPVFFRDTGDQPGAALALEGIATLVAPARPALALRLAGAAAAHRQRARQPLSAAEQAALDRHLGGPQRRLGTARAGRLQAAGAAADVVEIMTLALAAVAAPGWPPAPAATPGASATPTSAPPPPR